MSTAAVAAVATRGAFGQAPSEQAAARSAERGRDLIDVHHHLFPPAMIDVLSSKWPAMSLPGLARSLAEMDDGGTAAAMISFPNSDIVSLGETRLSQLIRESNDYATTLKHQHPGRYGLFASLPMPAIDASLREIGHAFDELHAEGILLISNYGNKWLGDPTFGPVLAELNRRKAIVYVHPNAADCCRALLGTLSDAIIEFQTDTTRTIASLLFSGAAERYSDIRFIFSHSGGTLPSLIERFTTATRMAPDLASKVPKGVMTYVRGFYYDTAQTANPTAVGGLLKIVPPAQVMFGTDFPYRRTTEQVKALQDLELGRAVLDGILAGNARRLLGRPRSGALARAGNRWPFWNRARVA